MNVFKNKSQYNPDRKLKPWIHTVASNAIIDHTRKNKRWNSRISLDYDTSKNPKLEGDNFLCSDPEDSSKGALDIIVEVEEEERVRNYIKLLPYHLNKVMSLVYFNGLKYREAADSLQIPIGTVKSRIYKSIAKIKKLMHRDRYRPAA